MVLVGAPDPYSTAFTADPWPVFRRLWDSAPAYVGEKRGFHALSCCSSG